MPDQYLGLVGGLGVGATMHYYRDLSMDSRAAEKTLKLLIAHADLARVFAYVQARDRQGLARYLFEFIRSMSASGATIAAISAVTPHLALDELRAICPLPIIDIFEPLKEAFAQRGVRRAAIFGTKFVVGSHLFGRFPAVEFVTPRPEELGIINNIYVQLTSDAEAREEHHSVLTRLAQTILARERIDAIVLAGTDFSLVFDAGNTNFPVLDCTQLHLTAIKKVMRAFENAGAKERL